MDLSTNAIFRHILVQIIKVLKHGKKQGDMSGKLKNMLGSKIEQEKARKSNKAYYKAR